VVDEDGRAIGDLAKRMGRDHVLARRVLPGPLHEVRLHSTGVAFDRARSAADARDQALGGQDLQVAVNCDRRDRVFAGQLADRCTAIAADVREDLDPPQFWWWLVAHSRDIAQTRST
jgi:hypothetical protein